MQRLERARTSGTAGRHLRRAREVGLIALLTAPIKWTTGSWARGLLRAAIAAVVIGLLHATLADAASPLDTAFGARAAATPRLAQGTLLTTTVDPLAPSRSLRRRPPPSFLGVSYEYRHFPFATGIPATGPNPLFDRLLSGLAAYGGGLPTVRIGGASSDDTFWNPNNQPRPYGINNSINPSFVAGATAFAARTRAPLILGLNLASRDPGVAATWASTARAAFGRGRVLSYELGNEPELYGIEPHSSTAGGAPIYVRPRSYSFRQYVSEFAARGRYLRRLLPGLPLSGPAIDSRWTQGVGYFLSRVRGMVNLATLHDYPLCTCVPNPRAFGHPSIAHLLSQEAVLGYVPRLIASARVQASRHHLEA